MCGGLLKHDNSPEGEEDEFCEFGDFSGSVLE